MKPKTPYQTVNQADAEPYDHNDASQPIPQHVPHEHPLDRSSGFGDSEYDSTATKSTQWSVGIMTPMVIIGFFVLATAVAVAHFLYCHFLDQKFVDETISQSWNAALSVAFARAFSVTLAASASAAFTQLLWWYLRRKAMSLSKIDALFSLNTSPLRLYELDLLATTPLLWFFGLLLPLISVATIFPPGSLVVQQLPDVRQSVMQVPTLDVDYRRNDSVAAFFEHAVFQGDIDGNYLAFNVSYRAREGGGPEWLTRPIDGFKCGGLRNISCHTQDTTYRAHVSYANFLQNVTLEVLEEDPVEKSVEKLDIDYPFWQIMDSTPLENGLINASSMSISLDEAYKIRHYYQILALKDMLIKPMTGYIMGYGDFMVGVYNTNTTIQETPLADPVYDAASYSYKDIYFKLSPSIVEQLMRNVTISMLNDATTNTTAEVTTTEYKAAYDFQDKPRLIVVYAATLGVSLVFVLLGLFALFQNGTPAFSGGFLQILCTTTYGESLVNQVAKDASHRGTENLPKDLAGLKVRYGLVTDNGSEKKYAAFGTVEETEVLLKGSSAQRR
ncbi:hypothetical protein E8E12_002286 [Didymella heteroderae]|uniref:Uncharacterized protein n=1 Tax=Didymella heteroderae TaxID=1769908 RepID=A0A9P4WKV7_9PLEO|nr:hypothetical protein E8E12_002286 [Didymella heteroderae]